MTTDYIKRGDALNFIENGIYMDTEATEYTIKRFNNAVPAADVVEVVRCKDCKHYKDNHRCYSKYSNMDNYRSPNDYCSYGEREDA